MRQRGKKHNCIRMTAIVLLVSLLVSLIPSMPQVQAADTMGTVLYSLVRSNLLAAEGADANKVSELTQEKVETLFKQTHPDGTDWSATSLVAVIQKAAAQTGVAWKIENGKDFSNQTISTNYSMGDLVVGYVRNNVASAAALDDAKLIQIYNGFAETGEVFPQVEILTKEVENAGKAAADSYSAQDFSGVISHEGMVTYMQYTIGQNRVVPNGTLFIGTFLIDASVLNDIFYTYAVQSISSKAQNVRLYKSELDGGRWKDIDSAAGLYDIMPTAETVPETELMNYYISCVIGKDGIPRKPADGSVLNIFEMDNPYEIDYLPEMMTLKMQFDNTLRKEAGESSNKAFTDKCIRYLFNLDGPETVNNYYPEDSVKRVIEINKKDMLLWNRYPWPGGMWRSHHGFINMAAEWAIDGRKHLYILNTLRDAWEVILMFDGGYYGAPRGTTVVPIISGGVNWRDERWFANEYAVNPSGERHHHWFWWNNDDADAVRMNSKFTNMMNEFEEWYRHLGNTRDEKTDVADKQLSSLQVMYIPMRSAGNTEQADILMTLMSKVDATRRAEVYYNLTLNDNNRHVLGPLLNYISKALRTGDSEFGLKYKSVLVPDTNDYHYTPDDATIGILDDAIADCQNSYIKYSSRSLAAGTTVLTEKEYEASMNVINTASNTSDFNAILKDLNTLGDIYNIEDSAVIHKEREIELINELLPKASNKFAGRIHEKANAEYQTLAANQATTEVLEGTLKNQKATASGAAAEMQQLIKAYCLRLNEYNGTRLINQRIDWSEAQRAAISTDPYGKYATQALEEHIAWLEEILKKIKNGTLLKDEGDEEQTQKQEYMGELLNALDNGNLDAAKKAEEKIDDLENKPPEFDGGNGNGDDNGGGEEEGGGDGGEPGGTNPKPSDVIKEIESRVMGNLEGDNEARLIDDLNTLGVLGSTRLDDIKKLLPADSSEEVVKAVDKAIDTAKKSNLNNKTNGSEGGAGGAGTGGAGTGGAGTGTGGAGTGTGGQGTGTGGQGTGGAGAGTGGQSTGQGTGGQGNGQGTGQGTGGQGNGQGTGQGAQNTAGTGLDNNTRDRLDRSMQDLFGGIFGDLPEDEKIAVIVACMRYGREKNNEMVMDYGRELLAQVVEERNVFVYHQFGGDAAAEYVSLAAIDRARNYTRYRYVRIGNEVTMSQLLDGSASYKFTIGDDQVEKANGLKERMNSNAVQQKDPYLRGSDTQKYGYIREDDAKKYLNDTAEYIEKTDWAALVTPSIDDKAEKFRGRLVEAIK